ncbi:MAG: hypothetical protein U9Q99_03240 [Nanoarchaeota archaeon]|nr:hypothetical protein [Nanoarchaeota archaeon]
MITKDKYQAIRDEAKAILNSPIEIKEEKYVPSKELQDLYTELEVSTDLNLKHSQNIYKFISDQNGKTITKFPEVNKSRLQEELNEMNNFQLYNSLMGSIDENYELNEKINDLYGGITEEKAKKLEKDKLNGLENKVIDSVDEDSQKKSKLEKTKYFQKIGNLFKTNEDSKTYELGRKIGWELASTVDRGKNVLRKKDLEERGAYKLGKKIGYNLAKLGDSIFNKKDKLTSVKDIKTYTPLEDQSLTPVDKALVLYQGEKEQKQSPTKEKSKNLLEKIINAYGNFGINEADKLTPVKDSSEYVSEVIGVKNKKLEEGLYSLKGGEMTAIEIPTEIKTYTPLEDQSLTPVDKALVLYQGEKEQKQSPTKEKSKNLLEKIINAYGNFGINEADKLTPVKDSSEYVSEVIGVKNKTKEKKKKIKKNKSTKVLFKNFPVNQNFFSEAIQEANKDFSESYEEVLKQEQSEGFYPTSILEKKITFPNYQEAFGEEFQKDNQYFKPELEKKSKKLRIIEKAENSNKEKNNFKFGANYNSLENNFPVSKEMSLISYQKEKASLENEETSTKDYFSNTFSKIRDLFNFRKQKTKPSKIEKIVLDTNIRSLTKIVPRLVERREFIDSSNNYPESQDIQKNFKSDKYLGNNLNKKAEDISNKFIQAIFNQEKKVKNKREPFIQKMRGIYGIPFNLDIPSVDISLPNEKNTKPLNFKGENTFQNRTMHK